MPIFDHQEWDTPLERGFYWLETEEGSAPASLIDVDVMPVAYLKHYATAYGILPLFIENMGENYNRAMLRDAAEMTARIGQPRAWDLHTANLGGAHSYDYYFDDSDEERTLIFTISPDSSYQVNGEYPAWYLHGLRRSYDFLLQTVHHEILFISAAQGDASVAIYSEAEVFDYIGT